MLIRKEDVQWGTVRSLLNSKSPDAWESLWILIEHWPSAEERVESIVPYCLDFIKKSPSFTKTSLVGYTSWFEDILYQSMLLEAKGDVRSAQTMYENCLYLKPDCIPASIALHRVRGRRIPLVEYCQRHPWDKIFGYGDGVDFIDSVEYILNNQNNDIGVQDRLIFLLGNVLSHQGSVYQTTTESIPFLIEILRRHPAENWSKYLAYLILSFGVYKLGYREAMLFHENTWRFLEENKQYKPMCSVDEDSPFVDLHLKTPVVGNLPFDDFGFSNKELEKPCFVGHRFDYDLNIVKETSLVHVFAPTYFLGRHVLPSKNIDDKYSYDAEWQIAEILVPQAVVSGLPVYINLYFQDISSDMKAIISDLIDLCGWYGSRIKLDMAIFSSKTSHGSTTTR